jgi:hypothetical protein
MSEQLSHLTDRQQNTREQLDRLLQAKQKYDFAIKNNNADANSKDVQLHQQLLLMIKKKKEEFVQCNKEIEELKTNLAMKEKALADMKAELDGFKKSVEEKKLSDQAEIEKIKKENETIKKENDFTKLLSEGKAVPAQKEAFMKGDLIEFAKLSAEVKLSENGHSKGANDESKKDVEDEILEQAKKLSEEKKITMKEAISQVLHSDKKLAEKRAAKFSDEA